MPNEKNLIPFDQRTESEAREYGRAGYSEKSASRIAVELLNKTQVSAEIQKQQAKRQKRVEITQENVLYYLYSVFTK